MSTRNPTPGVSRPASARTKYKVDKAATLPPAVVTRVDISSLEIVDDIDGNFDPYNNTGQHCLEAMRRAEERKKES